jgi:hypothetical protein
MLNRSFIPNFQGLIAWQASKWPIKGKKRHPLADIPGLLLVALVHSADIHAREGGLMLLARLACRFPSVRKLYADSAYRGLVSIRGLPPCCRNSLKCAR